MKFLEKVKQFYKKYEKQLSVGLGILLIVIATIIFITDQHTLSEKSPSTEKDNTTETTVVDEAHIIKPDETTIFSLKEMQSASKSGKTIKEKLPSDAKYIITANSEMLPADGEIEAINNVGSWKKYPTDSLSVSDKDTKTIEVLTKAEKTVFEYYNDKDEQICKLTIYPNIVTIEYPQRKNVTLTEYYFKSN